jgi:hypothetical protein
MPDQLWLNQRHEAVLSGLTYLLPRKGILMLNTTKAQIKSFAAFLRSSVSDQVAYKIQKLP